MDCQGRCNIDKSLECFVVMAGKQGAPSLEFGAWKKGRPWLVPGRRLISSLGQAENKPWAVDGEAEGEARIQNERKQSC